MLITRLCGAATARLEGSWGRKSANLRLAVLRFDESKIPALAPQGMSPQRLHGKRPPPRTSLAASGTEGMAKIAPQLWEYGNTANVGLRTGWRADDNQ
jgi:hypothetical protein